MIPALCNRSASNHLKCAVDGPTLLRSSRSRRYLFARPLSYNAQPEPLRILFCGADEFSIYSLQALHQVHVQNRSIIAAIDVVCRPDKRVGRGLKQVRQVPIKNVAINLGLPLHQIDTFQGWTPPSPFNVVITVSFGLLVPRRILALARYGGLNVHPSILPDLRGPAPIQHALLQGRSHTGVTLQTMHPTRFDHGKIICQTPLPGIPIPTNSVPDQMISLLGRRGADLLAESLTSHRFLIDETSSQAQQPLALSKASHAPKITPEDRRIDWDNWSADRILRTGRVLDRLWDTVTYQACLANRAKESKRIVFHGPWAELQVNPEQYDVAKPGEPVLAHQHQDSQGPRIAFWTFDKKLVTPDSFTIEGERTGGGRPVLAKGLAGPR